MQSNFKIAVNNYNFQWTFPEIVADSLGLFRDHGLVVRWKDVTPSGHVDKSTMYTELLSNGQTDLYHAGEWVCILRVLNSPDSRIVSKSVPGEGTLNSTFSLFARGDSGCKTAKDLRDKPIAIEVGTGSYYTAFQDLERFLPRDQIKLVQVGEPHKRLLSLMRNEVAAASLLSPWVDLAVHNGFVEIIRTTRSNPTTIVMRKDEGSDTLRRFFLAVNEAVDRINEEPGAFRSLYFGRVEKTLMDMPAPAKDARDWMRKNLRVPRWNHWVPYTEEDFRDTYSWMVERGLAPPGKRPQDVVAANLGGAFG